MRTSSPRGSAPRDPAFLRPFLEGLYFTYNRRELVRPDPLLFLYDYDDPLDREVVGLVASSLAYGRVAQILKSVARVLAPMGPHPHRFLLSSGQARLPKDFRHRFTTAGDVEDLFHGIGLALKTYGSLEALLHHCLERNEGMLDALNAFSDALVPRRRGFPLLTAPRDGSACKRLFLFLKWMVRSDDVDPGGWRVLSPRDLVMPTDTHIHAIALKLGLTTRKTANLDTALDITRAFREISPDDPTRYDFVLSRFGIRNGLNTETLAELLHD